jgi:hypothetical protein
MLVVLDGDLNDLSDAIYLLLSFRKSTPPHNRQLNVSISDRKRQVDDCTGDLTF